MLLRLKKFISLSPSLKRILLPAFLFFGSILYGIYQIFHRPFSYRLMDRTRLQFFPNGQIAKGLFLGGFERNEIIIFQSLLKPGAVMIDAGANIGLYSLIGSRMIGEKGKVYAFEPSKPNFNLFLKNIELNQIKNIIAVNKGLGDVVSDSLILSQNQDTGDAEKYIERKPQEESRTQDSVQPIAVGEVISLDTLDHFQQEHNIQKVDFIKIDVEGYEYYVLKGAENLLRKNPQLILLFECAEHLARRAGTSPEEVFDFLKSLGFELVYWNEKENRWSDNLKEAAFYGQLFGGKNIMATLNNLQWNATKKFM